MCNRIELLLRPSWPQALIVLLPWLAPALLCYWLPGSGGLRWLAATLILALGFYHHSAMALQWRARAPVYLFVHQDRCRLQDRQGREYPVTIAGASRLASSLAWLRIHGPGEAWALLLSSRTWIGNTDRDSLRRLLVWLRLSGGKVPSDSSPSTTL